MDILLSSGFLAFARHIGVLRAVEQTDTPIEGVFGSVPNAELLDKFVAIKMGGRGVTAKCKSGIMARMIDTHIPLAT